ncbi:S41 family peptidase [Polaribacter sp. Hel_I_88]|uniref:S41 family peptidase n=1 Tax=Polaribacter sp. Hel_I_88 TaxID=1250006 RepID=UPI000479CA4C|nr:S41 family peptidase [Polaribacter sp. Hel_I_88]
MKINFKIILLLICISTIVGCTKEYEIPQDLVISDFVWKGLNAYYLHQDLVPDLADTRFNSDEQLNNYLRSFPDYTTLFSSLLISSDVKSTLVEDYNTLTEPLPRTAFTNGLEFGIIANPANSDTVLGYVTHILPNSNASTKNIVRGEYFFAVNGVQLTKTNFQDLLLNGSDTFTLQMANFDGTIIIPNTKTVSLEKQAYTYPTTFIEKVIPVNKENIGYLMYQNDFSNNYINDLNNTFLNFKNQNVTKLILDLRYNIGTGGFSKNIAKIASMISEQNEDEILIKEQWNAKAQSWFLANQPDSLITKFPKTIGSNININSLNSTDVYIILNGTNFEGSSATELLINSLKPHTNVHIIGRQTAGNNTGSITLYNSEDYDFPLKNETHTVALQPIVLSFLNKNDQTYENGFSPNINLCENEDILDLGVLGEDSDPILNSVLNYISTGNAVSNTNCNPNNFDYLFNSINTQKTINTGIFIQQNLPNTN